MIGIKQLYLQILSRCYKGNKCKRRDSHFIPLPMPCTDNIYKWKHKAEINVFIVFVLLYYFLKWCGWSRIRIWFRVYFWHRLWFFFLITVSYVDKNPTLDTSHHYVPTATSFFFFLQFASKSNPKNIYNKFASAY